MLRLDKARDNLGECARLAIGVEDDVAGGSDVVGGVGDAHTEPRRADEGEVVGRALDDIEDWIDATGCISYAALCRYARRERPDWTPVIRTHTIHLTALLRSYEWEASIDKASK